MTSTWLVWISPFIAMGASRLTSVFTYRKDKPIWSWVPTILVFWGTMAVFIYLGSGFALLRNGAHVSGVGVWLFLVLSLAIGFIPLPILLSHWRLLSHKPVLLFWIAFGIMNPWLEETYWRGLLLSSVPSKSAFAIGFMVAFSSLLFAWNHSVSFGRISPAMSDRAVLLATFIMGIGWSLGYVFTHTLWFAIASHILVDLENLAVPVYMRLYMPPHLKREGEAAAI